MATEGAWKLRLHFRGPKRGVGADFVHELDLLQLSVVTFGS